MGCGGSKAVATVEQQEVPQQRKKLTRPSWEANPPMTVIELKRKKDEFWDTQPHYGGATEIWDTLKAVAEERGDDENNILILDAAGIRVHRKNLSTCYDERGYQYSLPNYVLSDPKNLQQDDPSTRGSGGGIDLTESSANRDGLTVNGGNNS